MTAPAPQLSQIAVMPRFFTYGIHEIYDKSSCFNINTSNYNFDNIDVTIVAQTPIMAIISVQTAILLLNLSFFN